MPHEFDAEEYPRRELLPLQLGASDIEAWLLQREPRAIGRWDEIGRDEYARAFTAARTAGTDVADDLYFGIVDTVGKGGTEADFSRLVTPILKAKGWLGGDEGEIAKRVQLIYDTNLRLARSSGRWTRFQASKAAFPYIRAFTVGDERVRHPPKSARSDHRAWDGIILPVDHPFWTVYWPPLGFRCRCAVVQMTRSQLARYKRGGITSEADLADRIARLGPPVFASPVAPMQAQLDAIVAKANASRMPGMPPVDPVATRRQGADAWDRERADVARRGVDQALERLGLPSARPAPPPAPRAPDKAKVDAAERDYVLKRGRKAGVEFLVAYDDATGETIQRSKGKRSSVALSNDLIRALSDPGRAITMHHNHPSSSSFSEADLDVASRPGAAGIWAHGHNGSSFYAAKGERPLSKSSFKAVAETLRVALQAELSAGRMSLADAQLMHNHLVWSRMSDLGQLVYSAEFAGESLAAWERNAELFARLLKDLFL